MKLIENYHKINSKITNIVKTKKIELIIVSKNQCSESIIKLIENCNHKHFGENRLQEAIMKWPSIKNAYKEIKLHFIGKLQSNKVKEVIKLFDYVHSIDSLKLAKLCSEEEKKLNKKLSYFIQVNFDDEIQKSGINENLITDLFNYCTTTLRINILGLMCIPPLNSDPVKYFIRLMLIAQKLDLKELSMGMSNDYEKAIKCGATFIRIGTAIFR
jgi:pyridoxal phosphate enzyme (YggS family)